MARDAPRPSEQNPLPLTVLCFLAEMREVRKGSMIIQSDDLAFAFEVVGTSGQVRDRWVVEIVYFLLLGKTYRDRRAAA